MFGKKLLVYFVFIVATVQSQTTAIPDANFEQRLIALGIDSNGLNGNILNTDAQAVTTLTLTGNTITNLTGLQAFVNVVNLDVDVNPVTTIPLNTLTALQILKISTNFVLTSLNLSSNVALKKLNIYGNATTTFTPITTLNLAFNVNLEDISIRWFRNLSNLTLPVTPTLKKIVIDWLAEPTLDFSQVSGLEELYLYYNVGPTIITLPSVAVNFKTIDIKNIPFLNINLSNFTRLETINLYATMVQNLTVPASTSLTEINIDYHNFQSVVNLTTLPNLKKLIITNNQSTPLTVNLTQNLLLEEINFNSNDMSVLNITQNVVLKELSLSQNNFTTVNTSQNVNLRNAFIRNNLLTSMNLSQNTLLEILDFSFNQLPALNINTNLELLIARLSNNLFTGTGLNLTNNLNLINLDLSYNQVSSLNITQNPRLSVLILNHNLFAGSNNIIQQYYNLRLAEGRLGSSQTLDVSFNQLSGPIVNLAALASAGPVTFLTNYFEFIFNNNNYQFGNFEGQHAAWVNLETITSPPPSSNPVMRKYQYAPQAKVNTVDVINATAGNSVTLTTTVSGAQNHYRWFKNNVLIAGAPDSPTYVINSVNPCDAGVYYSEIRSDLVPFANANPPGTNGKNLLLVRNNITLNVAPVANTCTTLTSPANGATNVPINSIITWTDSPNACFYTLSVGTTSGGTQILNNVNVGNVNSYTLPSNLPVNTQIFIRVTPNYQSGAPPACAVASFTTGSAILALPGCVTTIEPSNNELNVPVNQNITWVPVPTATGYFVSLGTTPGGTQLVNNANVGNVAAYNPTGDLPQGTVIFVTITPYNSDGNATGCTIFRFTVETIPSPPTCPTSYSIANNATNVSINLGGISWSSVSSQTIYNVSIGTTPGGTQYENYFFNNVSEYYSVPTPFAYSTTYYLTITVEDQSTGTTAVCNTIVFTTESAPLPSCTTLVSPANGSTNVAVNSNITWNAATGATGYRISIGTTPGGTQFVNNFNNGNSTTFNPATNFAPNTTYYVTITPFNAAGNATGCPSRSFTTAVLVVVPSCTTLISPANASTNVAVNANISWNAVTGATGYFISIGTTEIGRAHV